MSENTSVWNISEHLQHLLFEELILARMVEAWWVP
jgi:hypothetical protein